MHCQTYLGKTREIIQLKNHTSHQLVYQFQVYSSIKFSHQTIIMIILETEIQSKMCVYFWFDHRW